MQEHLADSVSATAGTKASTVAVYGAVGANLWLGLSPEWWNVVIGFIGMVLTVSINFYFKRRDDLRKERRVPRL